LRVRPLTREAFGPYGDVIDASGSPDALANGGLAQLYRDLARIDVETGGGRVAVNVVRTTPRELPLRIEVMERHPLGSQLFASLKGGDWLVLAAPAGRLRSDAIEAFRVGAHQGVNFRRDIWHHPLIALVDASEFLVLDRAGEGDNLVLEKLIEPLEIASLDE
jgi:ureidoglycolate lyase